MRSVNFSVLINTYNEIEVEVDITEKEFRLLEKYAGTCEREIHEFKTLEKLQKKIIDAAYDEMANGVYNNQSFIDEYLDGKYNFEKAREIIEDKYDLSPQWPNPKDLKSAERFEYDYSEDDLL